MVSGEQWPMRPGQEAGTGGQPGQDSQDRKARTGQPGQDSQDRTDCQDRTSLTERVGSDNCDWTAGKPGHDNV